MKIFRWGSFLYAVTALPAFADDVRNIAAAESQAYWAEASFWGTLVSILLSLFALVGLFFSLWQTQKALKETRSLGQRQARAYVDAADLQLSVDAGDLIVQCRNSGETPSPFFAVGVEAVRVPSTKMYHALENRHPVVPQKTWAALGKGAEWPAKVSPPRGSQAVREFVQGNFNDDDRLLVMGVIVYRDIFDRYFYTEFAFFTHNGIKDQFFRPNGQLLAYDEISKEQASKIMGIAL